MRHAHAYLPVHDHDATTGAIELAPGFFDHVHTVAGRVTWVDAPDTVSDAFREYDEATDADQDRFATGEEP